MPSRIVCTPRRLPGSDTLSALSLMGGAGDAGDGSEESGALGLLKKRREDADQASPAIIAVVRKLAWGSGGVRLTTGFMDSPTVALRNKILKHLNMWGSHANVSFVYSTTDPQVRIDRRRGAEWGGYWSYVGKEILQIPKNEPTMNFEGFTERTPDREFVRVVCHEAGHTLGFPHEHMRAELVQRIDKQKAYAYFRRTEGWSRSDVDAQVLTPLSRASLFSTPVDETSIMCYQLPGEITTDGKPIVGGVKINTSDYRFAAQVYPKPAAPVVKAKKKTKKKPAKKVAKKPSSRKKTTKK